MRNIIYGLVPDENFRAKLKFLYTFNKFFNGIFIMLTKFEIISFLKVIKPEFEKEGLIILGLFGSYAREKPNENSDIDILVETTKHFLKLHTGLGCFLKLENLRYLIADHFHKKVDIADKMGLGEISKNILEEIIYV